MRGIDIKRLFLSVEIPKKIEEALKTLEDALKKTACDAHWIKPTNIHLTLKFLGAVEEEKIAPITKAIISTFSSTQSLSVTLGKLGGFPSLNTLHILWAGINDPNKEITKLVNGVENTLSRLGFKEEKKEFQAHLTLARLRSALNKPQLIEKIQEINKTLQPQNFLINNITLFESHLTPQGSVYSKIHQVKLSSF